MERVYTPTQYLVMLVLSSIREMLNQHSDILAPVFLPSSQGDLTADQSVLHLAGWHPNMVIHHVPSVVVKGSLVGMRRSGLGRFGDDNSAHMPMIMDVRLNVLVYALSWEQTAYLSEILAWWIVSPPFVEGLIGEAAISAVNVSNVSITELGTTEYAQGQNAYVATVSVSMNSEGEFGLVKGELPIYETEEIVFERR